MAIFITMKAWINAKMINIYPKSSVIRKEKKKAIAEKWLRNEAFSIVYPQSYQEPNRIFI